MICQLGKGAGDRLVNVETSLLEKFQSATSKEDAKSIEMKVAEAENWVTQATNRISSGQPDHMVAAGCYEQAIQVYRTVPGAMRSEYHVDERIADLQQRLNQVTDQPVSQPESQQIITPEVMRFLSVIKSAMSRQEIHAELGIKDEKHFGELYQQPRLP